MKNAYKSLLSARDLLYKGTWVRLGSGNGIDAWEDPWIPDKYPRAAKGIGSILHPNLKVNHLINPFTKDWHLPIFHEFMDPMDIPLIRGLDVNPTYKSDILICHFTKSGKYTVKSGYWLGQKLVIKSGGEYVGERG